MVRSRLGTPRHTCRIVGARWYVPGRCAALGNTGPAHLPSPVSRASAEVCQNAPHTLRTPGTPFSKNRERVARPGIPNGSLAARLGIAQAYYRSGRAGAAGHAAPHPFFNTLLAVQGTCTGLSR